MKQFIVYLEDQPLFQLAVYPTSTLEQITQAIYNYNHQLNDYDIFLYNNNTPIHLDDNTRAITSGRMINYWHGITNGRIVLYHKNPKLLTELPRDVSGMLRTNYLTPRELGRLSQVNKSLAIDNDSIWRNKLMTDFNLNVNDVKKYIKNWDTNSYKQLYMELYKDRLQAVADEKWVIQMGFDVTDSSFVLEFGIDDRSPEAIRAAVRRGIREDYPGSVYTVLSSVILRMSGDLDLVKFLINHGAEPDSNTILDTAAWGDVNTLHYILTRFPTLNTKDTILRALKTAQNIKPIWGRIDDRTPIIEYLTELLNQYKI